MAVLTASSASFGQGYETTKPLKDFALITGSKGEIIGSISMIDGNQKAFFDANGRIVSGTGRFQYTAKLPTGLYVNFQFRVDGKVANGGIHISDMIVEYRSNGVGSNARQYVFIDQLTLANSQFEYAVIEDSGGELTSGPTTTTTVTETSLVDGRLRLKLSDLRGSKANQWFATELGQPLNGILQESDAPQPSKPK